VSDAVNARVAFYHDYNEEQNETYQYWFDLISVLERFNG
jgi:hypothetical protein